MRFFVVFLDPNSIPNKFKEKRPTSQQYWKNQYEIDVGALAAEAFRSKNSMKNRRFVGTSISETFWKDFKSVLGSQNRQF